MYIICSFNHVDHYNAYLNIQCIWLVYVSCDNCGIFCINVYNKNNNMLFICDILKITESIITFYLFHKLQSSHVESFSEEAIFLLETTSKLIQNIINSEYIAIIMLKRLYACRPLLL